MKENPFNIEFDIYHTNLIEKEETLTIEGITFEELINEEVTEVLDRAIEDIEKILNKRMLKNPWMSFMPQFTNYKVNISISEEKYKNLRTKKQ